MPRVLSSMVDGRWSMVDARCSMAAAGPMLYLGLSLLVLSLLALSGSSPAAAAEKPPEVTEVAGVQVKIVHKLHAGKVLTCFETPLEKLGIRMTRQEWGLLGNFVRAVSRESAHAAAQTVDQLDAGARQASVSVLYYPDGKPAFGLVVDFWHKSTDGYLVSAWYMIGGGSIIGGTPMLTITDPSGVKVFAELPLKDPGSVLKSADALKAAFTKTLESYYKRAIKDVAKLTECEPTPDAACNRVPASDEAKNKEKERLAVEKTLALQLVEVRFVALHALAAGLYPFTDPNCAIYSPDIPLPK